jgi:hypothetical protein
MRASRDGEVVDDRLDHCVPVARFEVNLGTFKSFDEAKQVNADHVAAIEGLCALKLVECTRGSRKRCRSASFISCADGIG